MAYYYKINDDGAVATPPLEGIQVYEENPAGCSGPSITYDFSKHVLIELLDNVTPEAKLWNELGLANDKNIIHKRMIVDPHRVNCRRAIVVCSTSDEAKELTQRLSQAKIMKRPICAVVIEALLSDICLFEKQIIQYGDKRSQHQLVYVTELTRCRDPTGLAQYLREKFSPFGTILSVLVSEDKDGYAYPEGVIKFAHLSEAFAAELAYDQCAVALERLSVTTHHNILLSQCDLRARLREAYSKKKSEFSFDVSSESVMTKSSKESDSDHSKIQSNNKFQHSVKESEKNQSVLNHSDSTINGNNEFTSDSAELADVLKMSSEPSNLIDCLQGIAECSESSLSRRASVNSLAETEPGSTDQSALPLNPNNTSTLLNKTWSSRIMGWITDLPNTDNSNPVGATTNDDVIENVTVSESVVLADKSENFGSNQQSTLTYPADVVSNTSSFVTCNNGDLNSSVHSVTTSCSDVSNSNNVTVLGDKTHSHDSESNDSEATDEETSNINDSSAIKLNDYPGLSLKRKNSSMMTEKLSLRSKRMNCSQSDSINEALDCETTVCLSSVPKTKSCSVVLSSVPELNEIAKNLSLQRTPIVALERLNTSQYTDGSLKINQTNIVNIENKAKSKKYMKKGIGSGSFSVKSQPVRRSNRLTSRDSDKRTLSISSLSLENGTKSLTSSANLVDRKEKSLNETESPLRLWLKRELESSRNNNVTRNKESTKRIVCAATNKDVLISVGCSHMTCDFCYPDSTKLLLGFH
ncbi:uncharacterized protein LOC129985287 [Argiope bruennichi]|uniref:uncharacterized protein LOC129985287 n=1 Tax=Argiope bruennichi TaxID=94029 RepID=UPI002494B5E3|nr:uncharacterized protein LOC129985287 [Argiope bruennichi]